MWTDRRLSGRHFYLDEKDGGVDDNYGHAPVTGELFSFLSLQEHIPRPYTFCPYIHTFTCAGAKRRVELLSTEPWMCAGTDPTRSWQGEPNAESI